MVNKLVVGILIACTSSVLYSQNCPDDINNSPGNSPNVVTATVYDSSGDEIQDITCESTGNSNQLDCDLDSYNFPNGSFVMIEISNGPNTTTCVYDENGGLLPNNPLPVQLLSFKVQPQGNKNRVSWKTASETDNDYFTLQHARDGLNWKVIDNVDGQGTTSEQNQYTLYDHGIAPGLNYYRLIQNDFDGKSEVISVKALHNSGCSISQRGDFVEISSDQEIAKVKCIRSTGQLVFNKQVQLSNRVLIQNNNFSNSFLIFQVQMVDGTMVRRKIFVD